MCVRSVGCGLLAGLWLLALSGCQKSSSSEAPSRPQTASAQAQLPAPEAIARLHWLGKKRLEGETNAAFFMSIWDLPESTKLEAQVLDKLSVAFAGFLTGSTNSGATTNVSIAGLIRPLLDDLLREECYFEASGSTNQPGEMALAIRLNEDRAGVWKSNLPKILAQFASSAVAADPHPWQSEFVIQNSKIKNRLALDRAGTWTVATLSRRPADAATPSLSLNLLSEISARIQKANAPFAASSTNFWLQAEIDVARLVNVLSCSDGLPAGVPNIILTLIGDGVNVRTRAELGFSKPLAIDVQPWNIPTNLVHNPLVGFTALNGLGSCLLSFPAWARQGLPTPNQLYLWSLEGAAVETYFAAPLRDGSNGVYTLSGKLIETANSWLNTNRMGELDRAPDGTGLTWKGFPFVAPFLKWLAWGNNGFAFGGFGPESAITNPPPEALLREITSHTNLICYDWEITGPRILSGIYISQVARVMLQKAQLPKESLSMEWLKALSTKLGNSGTEITVTSPTRISIVRKSGIGLTATELHLLADWFESPTFPVGLHTFVAPPPPPPGERVANSRTGP